MERLKRIELIQRSLGLRHKIKVHETMKTPDSHEDLAITLNAKWELEDELRAIEELLGEQRLRNVMSKKDAYMKEIRQDTKEADEDRKAEDKDSKRKTKK